MKIRPIEENDIEQIKSLHDKHFGKDFSFPDFTRKFLSNFIIETEDNEMIIAGGVQPIAETIIVTNKEEHSMTTIGRALVKAQEISLMTCEQFGIDWLHAFVKNEGYAKHLVRHGFNPRCQALSMKVRNGQR